MININFDVVADIIREVAETEIMPRFQRLQKADIAYKIGDDPVTIADKAAEKALSQRLLALLPGSTVVGEEDCAANPGVLERFSGESPVWIIDPIDGTRNFVAGRPLFGVIVALAKHNQTIAGWLYDPTSKEFITAEKGGGSYFQGRKLQVLPAEGLENLVGSLGTRIMRALDAAGGASIVPHPCYGRSMMAGCHEFARVAVAEPHFSRPGEPWHFRAILQTCTPWDDAAGLLIHAEAGGYAAHWNGEAILPSAYGRGYLIAPDRPSWQALRQWIAGFCDVVSTAR